jgi:hypothetical protein
MSNGEALTSSRVIDDQKNNALPLLAANGVSADFSCAASSALTLFAAKTVFREHLILDDQ